MDGPLNGTPSGEPGTKGIVYRNGRGPNMPATGTGIANTISGTYTASNTIDFDKAFYNNPMGIAACYNTDATDMAVNTTTHCGYLYNWYAATAGTGTYALQPPNNATNSICPTNFRLPSMRSGTGGPETDGTSTTVADFPKLNATMNSGNSTTSGSTTSYPAGWQPSGVWSGTFSGYRDSSGWSNQGTRGYFWSTSPNSTAYDAYRLYFFSSNVNLATTNGNLSSGLAVRCVLP